MPKKARPTRATITRFTTIAATALLLASASLGAAQAGNKLGWLWANQEDAVDTYVPSTSYSYNSSGGGITVTPLGTGVYRANFEGLKTNQPTNALATAYGGNGYCTVSNWSPEGGGVLGVTVRCFDSSGAPANNKFTLLYQSHATNFGSSKKGVAFLWADDPTNASYTPNSNYQFNSTGASNTMTRNGVGSYTAFLPGFDKTGGHFQVTAYSDTPARCKVGSWGSDVSGTTVDVLCFDATGAASDQEFTLAYSRALPIGYEGPNTTGVYAWTNRPKTPDYKPSGTYQFNGFGTGKLHVHRYGQGYTGTTTNSTGYLSSNMLVTGYGYDNSYCNVSGWEPLETICFKQGGNPKDVTYLVDFQVTLP